MLLKQVFFVFVKGLVRYYVAIYLELIFFCNKLNLRIPGNLLELLKDYLICKDANKSTEAKM